MILTPRQKLILRMSEREGKTQTVIADELRIGQPVVSRTLKRARQRITDFHANRPHDQLSDTLAAILN